MPVVRTLLLLLLSLAQGPASADEPFRFDRAAGLPERLTVSLEHRVRYEALNDQFRAGRGGNDDLLSLRTLIHGRLRVTDGFTVGAEFGDSRAHLDDPSTPLGTGIVNAAELIQAYGEFTQPVLGGNGSLRLGRITMDLGSRRLVARNRYRNTLNTFTGVDARWRDDRGRSAGAFYVLPLRRRPSAIDPVADDDAQLEKESFDVQFWGVHGGFRLPVGADGANVQLLFLGLHEEAGAGGTRNRDLYTPSLRIHRVPAIGRVDYQYELALQFGRSRASGASRRDLDHFAHFHHVELGYTFDAPWSPRAALQFDHASGDERPADGDNERFDTLFGARRFDFGPTSIWGPFTRSNLTSPGVRVQVKPHANVSSFVALRGYWLAERRDAWTTTGVRDATGRSGRHLGTQIELRVRWKIVPGNVLLETGLAHLFDGGFVHDAPNSNRQGDSSFAYVSLTFRL